MFSHFAKPETDAGIKSEPDHLINVVPFCIAVIPRIFADIKLSGHTTDSIMPTLLKLSCRTVTAFIKQELHHCTTGVLPLILIVPLRFTVAEVVRLFVISVCMVIDVCVSLPVAENALNLWNGA